MPVSSTAVAVIAGTLSHRKKPYFVAVAQELIASAAKAVSARHA